MKAALITGGANRLGKAIALSLAGMGYQIAVHHSRSDPSETLNQIEKTGVEALPFKADLAREDEVAGLIQKVKDSLPGLELIVNSASIFETGAINDTDFDLFNRHMNINFKAPFFLSRDFFRLVGQGNIINIVDGKISRNQHDHSIYLLSKKILMSFTQMAAVEFAPKVRINAIAPGAILPPPGEEQQYLEKRAKEAPLKRTGSPEDITKAVSFLLNNDFITGQCLNIDGGINLI